MPDKFYENEMWGEQNFADPRIRMQWLATRVSVLTTEKERLEQKLQEEVDSRKLLDARVSKMERVYNMGAGILWTIPFVAGALGFLAAYWKNIFAPWSAK